MGDFNAALKATLANEGGFFHNKTTGEVVNMGITHWTLRSLGFLTNKPRSVPASPDEIDYVMRLSLDTVSEIYKKEYWDKLALDSVADPLAAKVFDVGVNTGIGTSARFLQDAVNVLLWPSAIATDGVIGPNTLQEVNKAEADALLAQFKVEAAKYYRSIAQQPDKAGFLDGWLARLNK